MRLRFPILLATVACTLGIMLSVVAGHVRSAVHDWSEANYRMSDHAYTLTVIPDPGGEAPTADRAQRINTELRALLDGEDAVVVLDAQDGDGPRIGLYDPRGRFADIRMTTGRAFKPGDFARADPTAIIRADSYLVGREERYIPEDVTILGHYGPASVPFRTEYVYSLFTQENVHGVYYIDAQDPGIAEGLAAVLTANGYLVAKVKLDVDAWSIIQSEPLTYAYESSLLLVYGSALLLCLNWGASNKRRYLIERLCGARPASFTLRSVRLVALAAVVGTAVGVLVGMSVLRALGTLSVLPGAMELTVVVLANTVVLVALFTAAVVVQTSRWSRT
ncbi:hypothetical protein [Luethyella okanaganae]|uniref:FtsX-like permease family protein n=1 Tax=Luethyella okanaganae TaxID=69372 RepID=A0ABW1VAY6_9MICO